MSKTSWVVAVLVGTAGAFAVSLLFALPVMWCWDYAVAPVLGVEEITWAQAWCLGILCRLLFVAQGGSK